MMLIQVNILYFAALRSHTQRSEEQLSIAHGTTLSQLYQQLREHYQFTHTKEQLRAACNGQFCTWEQMLNDGDEIAFIPPVSGG